MLSSRKIQGLKSQLPKVSLSTSWCFRQASANWFVVIAALLIWLFAHFAAEPGKEVSAVWGLVKYTKRSKVITTKWAFLNNKISDLEEQLARAEKLAQVAEEKWNQVTANASAKTN